MFFIGGDYLCYSLEQGDSPPMKIKKCLVCNTIITKPNVKKYCSRDCYYKSKIGENNPFYGKSHSEETKNRMRGDPRLSHPGKRNPFYGKTHTSEVKELIKEKNRLFREENKKYLLQKRLDSKNLTEAQIKSSWGEYVSGPYNRKYLTDKLGIDYRTVQKFLVDLGIETKENIKKIGLEKKYFQNGRCISAPEMQLLSLLNKAFGAENVKHQPYKFGYFYDFLVNDKVLVEYDGYYYHKILINDNDTIKEKLALTNGFSFVRIEEDINRNADLNKGIRRIKDELQIKTN